MSPYSSYYITKLTILDMFLQTILFSLLVASQADSTVILDCQKDKKGQNDFILTGGGFNNFKTPSLLSSCCDAPVSRE